MSRSYDQDTSVLSHAFSWLRGTTQLIISLLENPDLVAEVARRHTGLSFQLDDISDRLEALADAFAIEAEGLSFDRFFGVLTELRKLKTAVREDMLSPESEALRASWEELATYLLRVASLKQLNVLYPMTYSVLVILGVIDDETGDDRFPDWGGSIELEALFSEPTEAEVADVSDRLLAPLAYGLAKSLAVEPRRVLPEGLEESLSQEPFLDVLAETESVVNQRELHLYYGWGTLPHPDRTLFLRFFRQLRSESLQFDLALKLLSMEANKPARWKVLMNGGGTLDVDGYRLYAESDAAAALEIPLRGGWSADYPGALTIGLENLDAQGLVLAIGPVAWHCRLREAAWTVRDGAAAIELGLANELVFDGRGIPILGELLDAEMKGDFDVTLGLNLNTLRPTFKVDHLRAEFHLATQSEGGTIRCDHVGVILALAEREAPPAATSKPVLKTEALASLTLDLDVITLSVQNLGLSFDWALSELDSVDLGFQPPRGVGLAVDTSAGGFRLKGGGLLEIDLDRRSYRGALQIDIGGKASLSLLALIDERPAFSMFATGGATFSQGIHISNGIYLNGVGGMIGIRRSMNVDAVRDGLKKGSLDAVLFPTNAVTDAGRYLPMLGEMFVPDPDHHLIGLMGLFSWADEPDKIELRVALLLELPRPVKLLILGRLEVRMPRKDQALVHLKGDFSIGWVPEKGTFWADASLRGSRAGPYPLTGDLAIRVGAGSDRHFVISAGGTHPNYPVPQLPDMERISLSIGRQKPPHIRVQGYLAVTPSALQAGLRAELVASAGGFTLEGWAEVDTYMRFRPFCLKSSFSAGVRIRRGSRSLFSLTLSGELEAFTPIRIRGRIRFKICWIKKVTIRCNLTLGSSRTASLPPPENLAEVLAKALANPSNWRRQTFEQDAAVLLREPPPSNPPERARVRLHPRAVLEVVQGKCPLETEIDRFQNAPVPEGRVHFTLRCRIDGDLEKVETVRDWFAPGQFRQLEDGDRWTAREFEEMPAGIRLQRNEITFGEATTIELDYEEKILDSRQAPARELEGHASHSDQETQADAGFQTRQSHYTLIHQPVDERKIVRVYEERFWVIDPWDGRPVRPEQPPTTWHRAHLQYLELLRDPAVEVSRVRVARFEEEFP